MLLWISGKFGPEAGYGTLSTNRPVDKGAEFLLHFDGSYSLKRFCYKLLSGEGIWLWNKRRKIRALLRYLLGKDPSKERFIGVCKEQEETRWKKWWGEPGKLTEIEKWHISGIFLGNGSIIAENGGKISIEMKFPEKGFVECLRKKIGLGRIVKNRREDWILRIEDSNEQLKFLRILHDKIPRMRGMIGKQPTS